MTRASRVSVVIPCFNHGQFLPEAVKSVASLGRDDVDLVVVDDGSTDERTAKEMDGLRAQGIRVIRQENKGLAGARNAGIAATSGEYVLPLDADNRIRREYIEHGTGILDVKPKVGVVYGDAEYIGEQQGRWHVGPFDRDRLLYWNYIDACAMYRRKIWEENGGYDGTMPTQGLEDWDFWLGALERGWEFQYVPKVLFDYRKMSGSMITGTYGHEADVIKFVATKHGSLFRGAWLSLVNDHQSVRWNVRNLPRVIRSSVKRRFGRNN